MLKQWQHVSGLAVAIGGSAFTAAFGGELAVWVAYGLAVALGVVLYRQGDSYATVGTIAGNVLIGYLAGIGLSFGVATGLLVWFINAPLDFAGWQVGLMMWDSWAGICVAVLSGFFVAGLAAPLS